MRSSKEESQNIIWFACYHKDEDSKEMKRTRLRDLKDSEENLVERKITQDEYKVLSGLLDTKKAELTA